MLSQISKEQTEDFRSHDAGRFRQALINFLVAEQQRLTISLRGGEGADLHRQQGAAQAVDDLLDSIASSIRR